ncbi:MAG: tetratricopeptide repeat protein [Polaromonas sp.]
MQIGPALHYGLLKTRAVLLLTLGRPLNALQQFEKMLGLRPADRHALASLAHLQAQLNHPEDAVHSLLQLTGIPGTTLQEASAWFNLGYVQQRLQRHEAAESAFGKAVALAPGMDQAWYGLAIAHMQQQQFHEALKALQINTALQPMSPYGWYRLAQVRLALGQSQEARAVVAHLRRFEPQVAAQLEREHALGGPGADLPTSLAPDAAH